jgi:pimeloyl-ACP methyl ester carboxylesterase
METSRGIARANGIEIAYQQFGLPGRETVLLIPGVGGQTQDGPDAVARELVGRGYHVVVYDSRDAGSSTHLDGAGKPNWELIQAALLAGTPPPVPYTLDDLAADAVGLLDAVGIRRVHVVGGSLGGMVAQTIAANYPDRVLSLTSISSSTGNPALPSGPGARSMATAAFAGEGSAAVARQAAAALAGDRRGRLRTIGAPTAVIHGDADAMFPLEHGRDTAAAIPGATLDVIAGMGHELPDDLVPRVVDDILAAAGRARARRVPPS